MSTPTFRLGIGDAVEWLANIPSSTVDLVITDPPYESLEKHRAVGTTTRLKASKSSSNQWFSIFPNNRFEELLIEVYRVLKRGSHFYLFCDPETMFVVKPIAERVGFKFWKPLIWDKMKIGMGYHYRARYENILFFEKGKRKLNDLGISDIISVPRVYNGYPTEKPVEVSRVLIAQSSLPGEFVVDPFMGSGSVGVAAVELGRCFMGNDISLESHSIAEGRLSAAGGSNEAIIEKTDEVLSLTRRTAKAEEVARESMVGKKSRLIENLGSPDSGPAQLKFADLDLDGQELQLKVCPKCTSREGRLIYKPIGEFGMRRMRNGTIKSQSYCKECR